MKMSITRRIILCLVIVLLLAYGMVYATQNSPLPLATTSDFKVIYYTTQGLIHGVNVYDHTSKIHMINTVYGARVDENFIPQFAYPPWYALTVFYLGLFPIENAAILWLEINLAMLFLSIFLLTSEWKKPLYKLLAYPLALLFYPVIGTLFVGQYDFPVLLGASLLIHALKNKRPVLTSLGMAFLTFKPHLGGLMLAVGLIYIFFQRVDFSRRSLLYTLYIGIFLFLVGFIADSAWPFNYINSLLGYRELGHITSCSECINISIRLARTLSGESSLSQAGTIAGILLTSLSVILYPLRAKLFRSPSMLIVSALMITLLASPYLYNYDFVLLLIPFALLMNTNLERIVIGICYVTTAIVLFRFGRAGNDILLLVSIVISILLYIRLKLQVDVRAPESYNVNN